MAPKGSSSKGKSSRHRSHKHRKDSDSEVEPVRKSKTSSKHRDGETESKRGHKRRQSGDSSRSSKKSKAEAEKLVVAGPELPSAWNDEQGSHEDVGAHLPAFEAGPTVEVGAEIRDGVASSCDSRSRKEKASATATENRAVTVVNSLDTVQVDDSLLGTNFRLKNNGSRNENVALEGDSKEEVDQTEGICSSRKGNKRLSNVEGHKDSDDSESCSPLLRSKERNRKREKMEKQKERKPDKGQSAGGSNEWRMEEEARNLELQELEIPMRPRKEESVDRDRRKHDDRERRHADHRENKQKEVKQKEDRSRRDFYDRNDDTYYKEGSRSPKTLLKPPESRNKEDVHYDSDRGYRSPYEGSLRKKDVDHGRSSYDRGKKSRSKDLLNDDEHRPREKGSKDEHSHRDDGVHISRQKSSKDERYYKDDGDRRSRQKRSKEDRYYRADDEYQSRQKESKDERYHRDEDEYFRDEDEYRSRQKESQQKGFKDERYHRDDDEHRSRQKGCYKDDDERQSRRKGSRDERYHRDEDEHQSRQKASKDERSYRDDPDNSRNDRERRGSSSKPSEDRIKKDRHYDSDRECRSPHDERSLRKEYSDHGRNSYDPESREKRSRSKDISNDDEYWSRQRGSKERYYDEHRSRHKGSKDERYYRDEDHKQERRKPDELRNERGRGGSSLSRSSMRSGNTSEDASGRIDRKPGIHRRGEMSVGAGDAWNWNRSQNNAFSPFPPHFSGHMPGGGFPGMRQPFPGPPMFGRAQMELGFVPNRFHGPGNHIGEEGYRSHAYSSWYGPGEVYDGRNPAMDGWDGSGEWERRGWDRDHDSWPRDDYAPHLQMESSYTVNRPAGESSWTGPQEAIGSSGKSEFKVKSQEAPVESSEPDGDAFVNDVRNGTRISKEMRLLLSRLNVSEELAGPEVYAQYCKFMEDEKIEMPTREMPVDIPTPTESDQDLVFEADPEAEALLKAPDVMDTIFPPLPENVFEAALKIYRRPAEENRLAKSLVGTLVLPFDPSQCKLHADLLQPELDHEKGSNKGKAVVAVDSLMGHHLEEESVGANSGRGDSNMIAVTHGQDIETCQNTIEVCKAEVDADKSVKMGDCQNPGEFFVDSLKEGNSFCNKLDGAVRDNGVVNRDSDLSGRLDKADELPGSNGIVNHLVNVVDFVEHSLQDRQLSNELELHDDVSSGASVQKAAEQKEVAVVDEDGAKGIASRSA